MDKKLIIEKIKAIVFGEEVVSAEPTVKVELEMVTLIDGTVVRVDSFEVGSPVFGQNADGTEEMPLADGEYTKEDGTVFKVVDGLISEIAEAMPTEDVAPEAEGEITIEMNEVDVNEVILNKLNEINEAYVKLTEKLASMESMIEANKVEFEAFKKTPASEPTKVEKNGFSFNKEKFNDRLEQLSKLRK